jgi:hypothetical protein
VTNPIIPEAFANCITGSGTISNKPLNPLPKGASDRIDADEQLMRLNYKGGRAAPFLL